MRPQSWPPTRSWRLFLRRPGCSIRSGVVADDGCADDPLPVPDGAPDQLRLRACQRLLDWVRENAASWTAQHDFEAIDLLVLSFFSRSSQTFRGVIVLGERGFGEQCSMLTRSLFEDTVDVHWVHANPDLATDRIAQHDKFSRYLRLQTRNAYRWVFDEADEPQPFTYTDAELEAWRETFGRHGSKSWTGTPSLHTRVEQIAHLWPTEDGARHLRFMRDYAYKMQNEILHPSGLSIARVGSPAGHADGTMEWNLGSTRVLLTQALFASLWSYTQTVGLIVQRYRESADPELSAKCAEADRDFRQAGHWERTGTLTPLPGSTAQNAPDQPP